MCISLMMTTYQKQVNAKIIRQIVIKIHFFFHFVVYQEKNINLCLSIGGRSHELIRFQGVMSLGEIKRHCFVAFSLTANVVTRK